MRLSAMQMWYRLRGMMITGNTMAQHEDSKMDVEDYLILDKSSQNVRYEYLDGELSVQVGGGPCHAAIIANHYSHW